MTVFLDTASRIGAQLCRDAIWDGDRCNWFGDAMDLVSNEWQVVHKSGGPDLYNGTSGIALFLAHLNRYRPDPLLATTARGAVRQALSRLDDVHPRKRGSLYSGWLSIAWALLQVGEMLDEPAWLAEADRLIETQLGREIDPYATDLLSGIAGTATFLLALWRRTHRDALVTESIRLGEALIALANRDGDAMSWTTLHPESGYQRRDLTGYSHGAAGIAVALLEIASVTGRQDFRDAADAGFRYERRWYSPHQQNWPDFRIDPRAPAQNPAQVTYAVAWCHGAPGIGLSRLRAYELTGDPEILHEAHAAIEGTYRSISVPNPYDNYSLCHGLGGNAEIFLAAARILGDPQYATIAGYIGQRGIGSIANAHKPWPCGVNGGGESPNLMIGIAGIGYFYLRLHDPLGMPSVLLLV